jgi:hypothetical protein
MLLVDKITRLRLLAALLPTWGFVAFRITGAGIGFAGPVYHSMFDGGWWEAGCDREDELNAVDPQFEIRSIGRGFGWPFEMIRTEAIYETDENATAAYCNRFVIAPTGVLANAILFVSSIVWLSKLDISKEKLHTQKKGQ